MIVFTTERLQAVPWREEHAEAAYAAYSRPDFVRFLANSTPHPDLEHTRAWVRRIAAASIGQRTGFWAVELRDGGELVGATLCQPLPGSDVRHEIGWHVFPTHQFKGYATEVGRGAADYAFDVLGLDEVFALVMPANEASLAVVRAVQMTSLGRTSDYYGIEAELFSLTRPKE